MSLPGDRSALAWRFRSQFLLGMESPWEVGIVLGFVLKSLNFQARAQGPWSVLQSR